jgi:hypothetical protein
MEAAAREDDRQPLVATDARLAVVGAWATADGMDPDFERKDDAGRVAIHSILTDLLTVRTTRDAKILECMDHIYGVMNGHNAALELLADAETARTERERRVREAAQGYVDGRNTKGIITALADGAP